MSSYSLVTPARNEAENLVRLADSLSRQSLLPTEWIIVDDGSDDGTGAVADEIAQRLPWARRIDSPGRRDEDITQGRVGGRDVIAFHAGVAALSGSPSVVFKLDADVSMAADYFARQLEEFAVNPRLGIASGTCWERDGEEWKPYYVTRSHARGATRAYRWECLQHVFPLEERLGWDVIDEIKARLNGWETMSLLDLPFYHHRGLGARDGVTFQWESQGALAHFVGYRFSYVLGRALFRARRDLNAFRMIGAYLRASMRRDERYHDDEVVSYLRREQRLRKVPRRAFEALGLGFDRRASTADAS
jgi:glycosyltransferase involved in cell wall biosynthesis